ncbi:MAG: hypothetical protein RR386_06015 [Bacteroidaceae bacterium]
MKHLVINFLLVMSVTSSLPIRAHHLGDSIPFVQPVDSVVSLKEAMVRKNKYEGMSKYEIRTQRYRKLWTHLAPNHMKLQFAGSIGLVSVGIGWHYGKHHDQWETDLLVGYLPKFDSEKSKPTLTIKQSYLPWHLPIQNTRLVYAPLTCGIFFNTVFGEDFWVNEPSKYPKKYYGFSTKIRTHLFVGQRITYQIPQQKRKYNKCVSVYYELSTCDLYLVSFATNKSIRFYDILSLSLGLRFETF